MRYHPLTADDRALMLRKIGVDTDHRIDRLAVRVHDLDHGDAGGLEHRLRGL